MVSSLIGGAIGAGGGLAAGVVISAALPFCGGECRKGIVKVTTPVGAFLGTVAPLISAPVALGIGLGLGGAVIGAGAGTVGSMFICTLVAGASALI